MKSIGLDSDILELEGIDWARENLWNTYKNNEIAIPRVTNIIKQCTDQSGLIEWAGRLGARKADYYRDKALNVGTIVHELIDSYLIWYAPYKDSKEFIDTIQFHELDDDYREQVFNAISSFINWHIGMKRKYNIDIDQVLFIEETVTCPWFGGTVDAILKINGANYLVDFKTSKQISTDYLVQASSYMWMINNDYAYHIPHIDGIGIIRVSKNNPDSYEDLFLNDFNPDQHNMIINYQNCFLSYVNAFYRNINTNYITNNFYQIYKTYDGFAENKYGK